MRITDQNIHRKHVITADGHVVGTVDTVFIDTAELRVDALSVAVRKDVAERLGLPHGTFRKAVVEIPARDVQSVGETVVLGIPLSGVRTTDPRATARPAPVRTEHEPHVAR
jgi:sporulation protein YlmC with PRC-barrel domain